ncbi:tyrosine-type recombinase/integrase [Nonomuraea sp. NPDC050394]|uniref:tyrosine-type recombinase/integrase n=1 Tax=Nonomuraea sp. NPDC050394 TaxID=3364363 RepID=UPI0037B2E2C3
MSAGLVPASVGTLALPPGLTGEARDLTVAWLLSYDSANTRDAYRRDIQRWFTFCAEHDLDPLAASRKHGDVYKRWLELQAGAPIPAKTMSRRLSAVSSWYDYLADEDAVDGNAFARVRRPRVNRRHSETVALTRVEAKTVKASADADEGRQRLRTAAIIRLLLETGVRVTELTAADVGDLGTERGYRTLRIVTKGAKPQTRPIPAAAAHALDVYLADRAENAGVRVDQLDGPLLATSTGGRLNRKDVYDLVARVGRAAGLPGLHPHQLRHTFASIAEEMGASVKQIQAALGHANSSTTDIYLETRNRLEDDPSTLVAAAIE